MANYKTKQREKIITYIQSLNGNHFTINQIIEYFKSNNIEVGLTTIYRQIEKLVEEGAVKKYTLDSNSGSCFQYVGSMDDNNTNYHLKCENCGELIHLKCKSLDNLEHHILEKHNFFVNPLKTVLYGTCDKCRKNK